MHRKVAPRLATGFVALLVALVAPVGVHGLRETCASATGAQTVAVVVDFGDVTGQGTQPAGVVTRCVDWSSGFRGADALRDAGFALRFHQSGLLCAIDGYPATGCGERTGSRYVYWSYWKATGGADSWTYAVTGAATKVNSGGTEGWRLVEGAGSPNDPQPRAPASHDATCTDADQPQGPVAPAAPGGDDGNAPDAAAPAGGGGASGHPVSGGGDEAAPDPSVIDGSTTSSSGVTTATNAPRADGLELAAATPETDDSSAGAIAGAAVVVALIALLGGGALWQSRRRVDRS